MFVQTDSRGSHNTISRKYVRTATIMGQNSGTHPAPYSRRVSESVKCESYDAIEDDVFICMSIPVQHSITKHIDLGELPG